MTSCPNCGRDLRPGAKFCGVCGHPTPSPSGRYLPTAGANVQGIAARQSGLLLEDGRLIFLSLPRMIVGRAASCDIVLPYDTVSQRHAEITNSGATYAVKDLGSTNGTWVNHNRVSEAVTLTDGDEVMFGRVPCIVQNAGGGTRVVAREHLPVVPAAISPHPVVAIPVGAPSPLLAPPPDMADIQLNQWKNAPQVEGKILDIQGPFMEKKGKMGGKVLAAIGLAMVAAPLAWLPFAADRNEIAVRFLRVQDVHTQRQISVKMLGDPTGAVQLGDVVAVWGKRAGGDLIVHMLYNYMTQTHIQCRG